MAIFYMLAGGCAPRTPCIAGGCAPRTPHWRLRRVIVPSMMIMLGT